MSMAGAAENQPGKSTGKVLAATKPKKWHRDKRIQVNFLLSLLIGFSNFIKFLVKIALI